MNNNFVEIVDDALYSVRHVKPEYKSLYLAHFLISKGITFPERTGHWIGRPIAGYCDVRCSECKSVFSSNSGKWNFCPECGVRMI